MPDQYSVGLTELLDKLGSVSPEISEHIEKLSQDAARYRWLRDGAKDMPSNPVVFHVSASINQESIGDIQGDQLDICIDMAAEIFSETQRGTRTTEDIENPGYPFLTDEEIIAQREINYIASAEPGGNEA